MPVRSDIGAGIGDVAMHPEGPRGLASRGGSHGGCGSGVRTVGCGLSSAWLIVDESPDPPGIECHVQRPPVLGCRGGLPVALPPLLGQLGPNAVADIVDLVSSPIKEGKG